MKTLNAIPAMRNPYEALAIRAGAHVLQHEDWESGIYIVLKDVCVCAGALTAGSWLANGKPCSKEEAIASSMFEAAPYLSLVPISASAAQDLFKQGFDWLVKHQDELPSSEHSMEQK